MNLLFILLLAFFAPKEKPFPPDDILGTWLTAGDDAAKVSVYKSGDKYYGKIIWLKIPIENGKPRTDDKNPDTANRNNPVIGLVIVKDFVWDESDQEWESGSVYDPASGNTYSGYMKLLSRDQLKLRGYIGISLLGRTEYWTRVE